MIKINAKESSLLSFETTIDGNIKQVESVSIIIPTERGFDIKLPATFSNNVVECTIPVLYDILNKGTHTFIMEMIIDGKKFEPLTEELFVEAPIEIIAKSTSSSSIVESETPVITTSPVIKTTILSSIIKKK